MTPTTTNTHTHTHTLQLYSICVWISDTEKRRKKCVLCLPNLIDKSPTLIRCRLKPKGTTGSNGTNKHKGLAIYLVVIGRRRANSHLSIPILFVHSLSLPYILTLFIKYKRDNRN